MIFYYFVKLSNYNFLNIDLIFCAINFIQPYIELNKFFQKKPFFNLKAYTRLLIKLVFFLKQKKTRLNVISSNWRFNFLNFKKYHFKIIMHYYKKPDLEIVKTLKHISSFDRFNKFFRKKLLFNLKKKILGRKIFFFKRKIVKLKKKFIKTLNNLRNYIFFKKKKSVIMLKYNIQIKITKSNIFLILQNLNEKQTVFFLSSGRIFNGKKKKNYLSSRFLTKTFIRLLIRFLFYFKKHYPSKMLKFLFTVSFNKSLTFFLVKSILNTFRFYKFPIYSIKNIYTTPHSLGVKKKKMRRL